MTDFDKSKKSPYFKYWNVDNFYGWEILNGQKILIVTNLRNKTEYIIHMKNLKHVLNHQSNH